AQETPNEPRNVMIAEVPRSTPEPTPTKQRQTQMMASSQLGQMLDLLGIGEPQWPEAVGVALVLDNNEYVVRSILIEPPDRRKLPRLDAFAEFEKNDCVKIKDDLLSALGNEIAVAGSLKTLGSAGFFGPPPAPKPSPSPGEAKSDQEQKGSDVFPMLLIAVKDR